MLQRPRLVIGVAFLVLSVVPAARATLIIDPGQCGEAASACFATNGVVATTAFTPVEIAPVPTDPAYVRFQQAFNSWNPGGWTLATDNLSAEAILDITQYTAYVNTTPANGVRCDGDVFCGGAVIDITYNNGGNPPFPISGCPSIGPDDPQCRPGSFPDGRAIWSQSILTTDKRVPSLPGNPYLDNAPGTPNASIGPPAYPFQYNTSSFFDAPNRDATAFWLADAWISSVDTTKDILTIYDGVQWGFNVVPEPASLVLLATGLLGLGVMRRRRQGV